jgi:endogenous inhibitor of DNA gyrase (YacG/DUF329 family)
MAKIKKGEHKSILTEFKKGCIPLNKGNGKKYGIKIICKTCKKEYIRTKNKGSIYCSKKCQGNDIEWKEKMSVDFKKRGHRPPAEFMTGNHMKGSKNHNWKGGLCSSNRKLRVSLNWKIWRNKVFERDSFVCCECKTKGGLLHPHHIIPVKECLDTNRIDLVFDINNGLTLCYKCHMNLHGLFKKEN